jgi:hypothetical protein
MIVLARTNTSLPDKTDEGKGQQQISRPDQDRLAWSRQFLMVMGSAGPETKNVSADEGQQLINRPDQTRPDQTRADHTRTAWWRSAENYCSAESGHIKTNPSSH